MRINIHHIILNPAQVLDISSTRSTIATIADIDTASYLTCGIAASDGGHI